MKRIGLGVGVLLLLGGAVAWSSGQGARSLFDFQQEQRNPVSHLRLNNDPASFQFAIISDRTGGHRAQVFARAVEQLNLLQPEFVVSVGDLIEGYSEDRDKLAAEWREFQTYLNKLRMPFFYVPGNHDLSNPVQEQVWKEKFGRRYYHFVYRNVLFVMLNSEDPPQKEEGFVGPDQLRFLQDTLQANPNVAWTFVLLHKPMWIMGQVEKNGWQEAEKLLNGRRYTVFAGHVHRYQKFVLQGQEYYMLATTGGASKMRGVPYGEFDHFVWVTVKKDGPVIANLLMDGILPENLQPIENNEPASTRFGQRPTERVRGKLTDTNGQPIAGALVTLHPADRRAGTAECDGMTDDRGEFSLSTYSASDGTVAGKYKVTVVMRRPLYDASGNPGPNLLPAKYARADQSPLQVEIQRGSNNLTFQVERKQGENQ